MVMNQVNHLIQILQKKWTSVRDLDDLFTKFGKEEGGKKVVDLESAGYEKTSWWRKN